MIRDPRYLLPLGLLAAVIAVSFALGRGESHAQAVPRVTPTAAVAPTSDDAAIDARRMSDLQRISDALGVFYQDQGSYPSTKNAITRVCGSNTDAGCELKAVAPDLTYVDGDEPYYYASDGSRFALIVRAKAANDSTQCPLGLPAEMAAGPVICLSSEGGTR